MPSHLLKVPAYRIWAGMLSRCRNPKASGFHKYGGRGVTVCDRWLSFSAFLEDVGHRPSPAHTLDRIDGTKGYEPGNVRWATQKEQQNNRMNNRRITLYGEDLTVNQWSERTGIPHQTIHNRLKFGWPVERALTEPSMLGRRRVLPLKG